MAEFSGEQKLRIVLESILRNVPKGEQCQKYGITEAEFDRWNHKLITDGGKIYDEYKPVTSGYRGPLMAKLRALAKIGIILSILINLGCLCALGVWFLIDEEEEFEPKEFVVQEVVEDVSPDLPDYENPVFGGGNQSSLREPNIENDDLKSFIAGFDAPVEDSSPALESLLADPLKLPTPEEAMKSICCPKK